MLYVFIPSQALIPPLIIHAFSNVSHISASILKVKVIMIPNHPSMFNRIIYAQFLT